MGTECKQEKEKYLLPEKTNLSTHSIKNINDSKRKKIKTPERVNLTKESIAKIDLWQEQIKPLLTSVKLSRSDLVNWVLDQQCDKLLEKTKQELADAFFDPVKALESATKKAKELAAKGEKIDLNLILTSKFPKKKVREKRKQNLKANSSDQQLKK